MRPYGPHFRRIGRRNETPGIGAGCRHRGLRGEEVQSIPWDSLAPGPPILVSGAKPSVGSICTAPGSVGPVDRSVGDVLSREKTPSKQATKVFVFKSNLMPA